MRSEVLANLVLEAALIRKLDAEPDRHPAGPPFGCAADHPFPARVVGVLVGRRTGHEVEMVRDRDLADAKLGGLSTVELERDGRIRRELRV